MADMTVVGIERTTLIEQAFGELALGVAGVETFLTYRPEEIPSSNAVCMYFDWRGTAARATGRISRKTWEWVIEIYIQGYERQDMQQRMKAIIIGIDDALEGDLTLNRAASRPVRLENMGPPIPYVAQENGPRGLLKRFRLIAEAEQAI